MKLVRKAVLATAVAASMAPMAASADAKLYGEVDLAVALETAEENAFAVTGSPVGDNRIGFGGETEMYDGGAITYQAEVAITPEQNNAGFASNYHSYIGYKTDGYELRAGNQHLPLRKVMDQADLFMGTYLDQSPLMPTTTVGASVPNSVMALGGDDAMKWAFSVDFQSENPNDPDSFDGHRYGAAVDMSASDTLSFAVGAEFVTDNYMALGATANMDLGGGTALVAGVNMQDNDANDTTPMGMTFGLSMAASDRTTYKAQLGMLDPDTGADNAMLIGAGVDHKVADNATTYALVGIGQDGGLTTTGGVDADAAANVFAVGVKLSF